jgi:O-antigen/teichoic acid export membrane protein
MTLSPRRALAWSFAERYAGFVIAVGSTLLLSRLLTPAQVGVYSLCAALLAVMGILREFGVSDFLIQAPEISPQQQRAASTVAVGVGWALAVALFSSRHWVAGYFGEPAVALVLAVMALNLALLPVSAPALALLHREMAFHQIAMLQTACALANSGVAISMALAGYGTLALACGPTAGVLAQTLVLAWLRPRDVFVRPGIALALPVLQFGWMYMSSRLIETAAKNVHEPVIAKQFDFTTVGLFSRAHGMVELFHSNVADAVVRVTTPAFAAEHRGGRPLADSFARATALFVSISWPFFGFVALMSEEIIGLMFGPQWLAAAPIASVLALSALPGGLYEMVPQLLSATGHVQRRLRIAVWVAPAHILGVLLASAWGLQAIAAVSLFSSLLMLALCRQHLRAALGVRMGELLRPSAASAGLAAASLACMAATAWLARNGGLPPWLVLLGTLSVGMASWWAVGRSIGHPACGELLRAWRDVMLARREHKPSGSAAR